MFCRCKNEKPIVIYQGDDTDFIGNPRVYLELETDLELEGITATFEFLGVEKTFTEIPENKLLAVEFTKEETKTFPVGNAFASLKLTDSNGRVRTVSSDIGIHVTDNVDVAYNITDDNIINLSITKSCPGGGDVDVDDTLTATSSNPVKSRGIWNAIWGALTMIPDGAASLYEWITSRLSSKQDKLEAGDNITIADNVISATGGGSVEVDNMLSQNSPNPVKSSGIWSAIWGSGGSGGYDSVISLLKGEFREFQDLRYFIEKLQYADTWTFDLKLGGNSFDTVDLTLLSSEDSPSISIRKREVWHGLTKDSRYYTTLELLHSTFETSATLTVAITGVTPVPSVMGYAATGFTTLDLSESGNPLSATGSLSTKNTNVLVVYDSLALAGEIEKELKTKLNKTDVVIPDASAAEGQAADAMATYEQISAASELAGLAKTTADTALQDAFDYHKNALDMIDALDASKQNKLTAGAGITIDENNVISATGGGGSSTIDGTTNNLVAIGEGGAPVDAGYRFEVRNGIPCIVQTIAD